MTKNYRTITNCVALCNFVIIVVVINDLIRDRLGCHRSALQCHKIVETLDVEKIEKNHYGGNNE